MSSVAGGTAGHGMSGGLDHVVNGYCPPLPYITPRTVHRLITTAILLAHRAVNPSSSSSSSSSLSSPAIRKLLEQANMDVETLQSMMDWMMHTMGDLGLYVSVDTLEYWMESWGQIFGLNVDVEESYNDDDDDNDENDDGGAYDDARYPPPQSHNQEGLYHPSSYENQYNEERNHHGNDDNASYWGNTHDAAMSCWS